MATARSAPFSVSAFPVGDWGGGSRPFRPPDFWRRNFPARWAGLRDGGPLGLRLAQEGGAFEGVAAPPTVRRSGTPPAFAKATARQAGVREVLVVFLGIAMFPSSLRATADSSRSSRAIMGVIQGGCAGLVLAAVVGTGMLIFCRRRVGWRWVFHVRRRGRAVLAPAVQGRRGRYWVLFWVGALGWCLGR